MAPQILPCDPSDVAQPTASLDLSETEDEKNELKGLKDVCIITRQVLFIYVFCFQVLN